MIYLVDDTYTKIAETTGTIQNGDTIYDLEINAYELATSDTWRFTLNPHDSEIFVDTEISVRCKEQGEKILARVVPFILLKV